VVGSASHYTHRVSSYKLKGFDLTPGVLPYEHPNNLIDPPFRFAQPFLPPDFDAIVNGHSIDGVTPWSPLAPGDMAAACALGSNDNVLE
jgi:hypothetical protein